MEQRLFKNLGKLSFFSLLIFLTGTLAACSQGASPEACADFNSAIDRNIVEIAVSAVDGSTSDKSAVQQSARLAQNNNRLSTIMVNVQLQVQNHCQPRQKPIDASIYSTQASSCYNKRLEQMTASYGSDEEKKTSANGNAELACDFNAWTQKL